MEPPHLPGMMLTSHVNCLNRFFPYVLLPFVSLFIGILRLFSLSNFYKIFWGVLKKTIGKILNYD